ncbi:hypothetical protein [Hyalangium sp.]|uniref:hypothetical protein n=1 Tax=Hyalangium sp. TaxID=2028555 RepID=UPI002D4B4DBB|nr:hypothetical protein [Hyalangium sp.]HYH98540.1 hypothetical protein [Hyalangium sp.]
MEEWEQRLKDEAHTLIQQELAQGVGASKPRTLSELQQLLEMAERIARKRKKHAYLPTVVVVVIAVLGVLGMSVTRLSTTEIELSARMSGFDATLGRRYKLLRDNLAATALSVSGASRLRIPDETGRPQLLKAPKEPGLTLMVSPQPDAGTSPMTLKLRPFFLPAHTRFALSAASARDVAIDLQQPEVLLQADFAGPIHLDVTGVVSRPVALETASGFLAWSGADSRIDIQAAQALGCILCLPVPVTQLAFGSTDEGFDGRDRVVTPFSRLTSGTLVLRDLGNKEIPLRLGTPLLLGVQRGELGPASIDSEGQVSIVFHGNVDRLEIGLDHNARNLMPSYLEWIAFNQRLELGWGALLFVMALIASVWSWFQGHS